MKVHSLPTTRFYCQPSFHYSQWPDLLQLYSSCANEKLSTKAASHRHQCLIHRQQRIYKTNKIAIFNIMPCAVRAIEIVIRTIRKASKLKEMVNCLEFGMMRTNGFRFHFITEYIEDICPYATFQLNKQTYSESSYSGNVYSGPYHSVRGSFVYHDAKPDGSHVSAFLNFQFQNV